MCIRDRFVLALLHCINLSFFFQALPIWLLFQTANSPLLIPTLEFLCSLLRSPPPTLRSASPSLQAPCPQRSNVLFYPGSGVETVTSDRNMYHDILGQSGIIPWLIYIYLGWLFYIGPLISVLYHEEWDGLEQKWVATCDPGDSSRSVL